MVLYAVMALFLKLPPYDWVRETYLTYRRPWVEQIGPVTLPKTGRWRPAKDRRPPENLTQEQLDAMARLQSIGYLSGYEMASDRSNITVFDPEKADSGLNLYTSGDSPSAVLMDMDGRSLHTWKYDFRTAFPGYPVPGGSNAPDYWRRVHLYPNGDLLAIYEGLGMIKLDRDSNLLWSLDQQCHHDLFVKESGLIYVLTRKAHIQPRIHPTKPILEDFISVLTPEGSLFRRVSLLRAFEKSSFSHLLETMPDSGDLFHTNTIEIFDGSLADRSPLFKKGNALVSMLNIHCIAILDLSQEKVVWAATGDWRAQHQPSLLQNGNILFFDNRGNRGRSRVMEIDPITRKVVWEYMGTKEVSFYSHDCGSVLRLSNGNTLVTESNSGRAFELSPQNEIVWEFYNPARAGKRKELVATLFELIRIPIGQIEEWWKTE